MLWLKMLAPYLAVAIFWCWLQNGWLTILAYHAQILFWSRAVKGGRAIPRSKVLLLALPATLAGPLTYVLLLLVTHAEISAWLTQHHLAGWSLLTMIPYFGLVHPLLEQWHWAGLREKAPIAHWMFAGYHVLVLYSLVDAPWLLLLFLLLVGTSVVWKELTVRYGTPAVPIVSHVLADLGIIVAAWLSAQGN